MGYSDRALKISINTAISSKRNSKKLEFFESYLIKGLRDTPSNKKCKQMIIYDKNQNLYIK